MKAEWLDEGDSAGPIPGGGGQVGLVCLWRSPPTSRRGPPCAHGTRERRRTGHDRSPLLKTCDAGTPALCQADTHAWRSANAASVMGMDGQATAARLLVRCQQNEGVTVVCGIPGEDNIRFTRALDDSPIRYVLTRHEQATTRKDRKSVV